MELCVCDGGSTSVKPFCNRVVSQERKTLKNQEIGV